MATQRSVSFNLTAKDQASATLKSATQAVERLRAAQEKKTNLKSIIEAKAELRKLTTEYQGAQAAFAKSAKAMDSAFSAESLGTAGARETAAAYREQKAAVEGLAASVAAATAKLNGLRGSNQGSYAEFSRSADAMRKEAAAALAAAEGLRARRDALLASQTPARQADPAAPTNRLQAALAPMREAATESRRLASEYENLRTQTGLLGRTLAQTSAPTEAMVNDFAAAKARLAELRTEMERAVAQTGRLTTGFAAFSRRADGGTATGAVGAAAATSGSWWSRKVDEFTGAAATAQGRGPLGLRPYELQNLGYQINDVFTQLASGTPIMQVFAQQSGQIAQIFPKAVASIIKFAPAVAGATAVIIPLVAAISRLRESARIADEFGLRLAASADGARYSAEQLTTLVRDLEGVGIAAESSKTAIMAMMQEGLSVERMQEFLVTAKDFSAVWGVDIPAATQTVMASFNGTLEAVRELDKSINFLTAEQYKSIKALYEQGREAEATEQALGIFQERMSEAADQARGPWSEAMTSLGTAWRDLLDYLSNTLAIQAAIAGMDGLARATSAVIGALTKFQGMEKPELPNWLRAALPGGIVAFDGPSGPAASTGGPARASDAPAGISEASKKAVADAAKVQADADAEALKTYTDRISETLFEDRVRREKDRAAALAKIEEDIAESKRQTALAGMSDEQRAIADALFQAEQTAGKAGLKLSQEQRAEIEATTGALVRQKGAASAAKNAGGGGKAASEESSRQKELEEALNLVLERRRLLMEQIEYQDESGNKATADRLREQMGGVNDQVRVAIQNMREFWESVGGPEAATGLARLDSFEMELREIGKTAFTSGEQMNEMLAEGGADAIDKFSEGLSKGEGFIKSMANAFREFAADFLKQIAGMIAKQVLLNALQRGQGKAGGVGGILSSVLNGIVMHRGGIVGAGGLPGRRVSASVFANAPRFHSGGVLGLRPGEMPIIGQKGEEMLTRSDPRHALNGGGAAPTVNLKNVNVFDPNDVVRNSVGTEAGQRIVLNFMSTNSGRVRAALGI